ncbi:MAG: cytochrome c-type biogenesis protein CcmH [Chlamydiae bacterium]|nr:cytochrome c-type biogenesis protein CcmH [Chlamydiota bacterium]
MMNTIEIKNQKSKIKMTIQNFKFWILICHFDICILIFAFSCNPSYGDLENPEQVKTFQSVSEKLVCQCGCFMMLSVCNHPHCPSAIPLRQQIEERIQAGANSETILHELIETYGSKILSSPPTHGFNLTAWVMPGMGLIIGLIIVFFSLKSLKKKKSDQKSIPIDSDINKRIEKELEEWEE